LPYLAPEVLNKLEHNVLNAEVFNLGTILLKIVTGVSFVETYDYSKYFDK
jgi:hypothetical protein